MHRTPSANAVVVGLVALAGLSRVVAAQTYATEHAVSLSAGVSTAGALWRLPAQPSLAGSGAGFDTLELARRFQPGLTLGVGVTRFLRPGLGLGIEALGVVAPMESNCRLRVPVQPDPTELNGQTCNYVNRMRITATAFALQGTATLRASPRRNVSPFVRAAGGIALLGRGYVQMQAEYLTETGAVGVRRVLDAPGRLVTWTATVAAGVTLGSGPGGRFRMEIRDIIIGLPVVAGPADAMATEHPVPATSFRAVHRPTLVLGVDAVLGGPHQRRY